MQLKRIAGVMLLGCLAAEMSFAQSSYGVSETDTTELGGAKNSLTSVEKAEARKWSLTDTDWIKYKEIMAGPRGVWSPGLDPITALGVSETDAKERRRYADIWMQVETRRIELELAFEKERLLAGRRLHGDTKRIENDAWIAEWNRKQSAITTIINYFVDPACLVECAVKTNQLLASVSETSKLDIYFKPGSTENEAGEWAAHFNIDPKIVATRKITLNLTGPKLKAFGIDVNDLPQVRVEDVKSGRVIETFVD